MQPDGSEFLMPVVVRPDAVMIRGEGSYLWDDRGRRYLDFVQGWAVNALGHCPREIERVLSRQAGTLLTTSPAYHTAPQLALAQRLTSLGEMAHAYFCVSGAEANEGAIKLARKWGRAHRHGSFEIVSTHDGFHGRTLAAMAASGKPGWDELFPPSVPGFRKVPFGDLSATRAALGTNTAAIL